MSFIGGYQSSTNLNDLNFVGDFPIDHAIGGFGIGVHKNDYKVTLNTAIAQYRQGMLLELVFAEANDGPVTIDISKRGAKSLKKPTPEGLLDLDAGEINTSTVYLVVYDGQGFQVATPLFNYGFPYKAGTGIGSIIPRLGNGNIASGNYAVVLNGENNLAQGAYSIAEGSYAMAVLFNERVKAGGAFFNEPGSAQCSIHNLFATINPNSGSVKLTPDGKNDESNRWMIPDNCIQRLCIQLVITQNSGTVDVAGLACTAFLSGTIRCQKGSAQWVGKVPQFSQVHKDEGFDPVFGITMQGTEVILFVKDMAERVLHANATVHLTQTKFSLK